AAFVRRIDRLPLPVRSAPGFLVNRILLPYLLEAVQLLQEGVPPAIVDRAATGFGMPVGPVRLADQVGLDICLAVAEKLQPGHGEPLPALLREKVEAGELGRKSGTGFYRYDDRGRPLGGGGGRGPVDAELADRMIYRLLNESLACLREGLVADADLLDAGVVFGTGFAPFRGGPLRHIRETGPRRCRQRLAELERQHGERFRADAGWDLLSPPDTARQSMAAGDLPPPGHRPAFHL
ncbi:MAG TPA: hypothetical protein ENI96_10130, partial [Sedimenticola thiotaurini]|nr:hypothetical protein [Sedimenticola thiotaurini]